MDLVSEATGIPAERADIAPVTLVGAAHYWAGRAKAAELELAPLRRRLMIWRALFLGLALTWPVGATVLGFLWTRG